MKLSSKIKKGQEAPGALIEESISTEEEALKKRPDRCPDDMLCHKKFRYLLWGGA